MTALCPRGTGWCVEHDVDNNLCASLYLSAGRVGVWLVQEITGIEPTIFVDTPTSGADLTLCEAVDLADSIEQLRQAARANEPVRL